MLADKNMLAPGGAMPINATGIVARLVTTKLPETFTLASAAAAMHAHLHMRRHPLRRQQQGWQVGAELDSRVTMLIGLILLGRHPAIPYAP